MSATRKRSDAQAENGEYEDMDWDEIVAPEQSSRVVFSAGPRKLPPRASWVQNEASVQLASRPPVRSEQPYEARGGLEARHPPEGEKEERKRRWYDDKPLAYHMPETVQTMGVTSG